LVDSFFALCPAEFTGATAHIDAVPSEDHAMIHGMNTV
jgi:hypothetical protein